MSEKCNIHFKKLITVKPPYSGHLSTADTFLGNG